MATFEAVAGAARTLQALLADRLEHPNGTDAPVPVTLGAPGPERDPEGAPEAPRVNLFLYQVVENGYLANQEIPGLGHPGAYGHPALCLNLHFLLTVFGSTANGEFFDETPAHLLLGSAMRALHDEAIITESVVGRRRARGMALLDPELHGEHEQVKLTLRPLALEDLSNVWTALALPFRLSVGYEMSVVQIESGRPRRYPRPVGEPHDAGPRVHVTALRRPRLVSVAVRRADDPPGTERAVPFARIGDTLVLRGSGLGGEGLAVRLGRLQLPPDAGVAGDSAEVRVPDDALPDGATIPPADRLQPGTSAVTVVATVPDLPATAVASGQAAFVLVPGVEAVSVDGRIVTLEGSRLTAPGLPAQTVIGETVVESQDYIAGSDDTRVELRLPDTTPAWPVNALISGDLSTFPDLSGDFDLSVAIGGEGPETATLSGTPRSLSEAADLLEAALRAAAPGPGFRGARVGATERELVVVPGGLSDSVTFEPGGLADALALSPAPGGAPRDVYLSGVLRPFPVLTTSSPELELTIGGSAERVSLSTAPTSPAEAAGRLEVAIQAVPSPPFAATRVTPLGDQLCIVPPPATPVAAAATESDELTVAELQLSGSFPVRIRVGGVESFDEHMLELPP